MNNKYLALCVNVMMISSMFFTGGCEKKDKEKKEAVSVKKQISAPAVKSYETEEEVKKDAEAGDANAQCTLGWFYAKSAVNAQDIVEAVKWFRKAAEQGHTEAQYNLAYSYENGRGVEKKLTEAFKWYRKSAENGLAEAQLKIGSFYAMGTGVEKNMAEAIKWWNLAAEKGNPVALFNLSACYARGEGVPKDLKKSFEFCRRAAEAGDAQAMFNMGGIYFNGDGVAKDPVKAFHWYKKSAEAGFTNGQFNTGWCYANGIGVEKNIIEAAHWYRTAGEMDRAVAELDKIKINHIKDYTKDVKFIYKPANYEKNPDDNEEISFVKNGKVLFHIKGRLCFMEELWAMRKENRRRISFSHLNLADKNFDYRTMLHDIKSNGDFRYLFIADYHTGNSPSGNYAYVLDVKDNFKLIGKIDAGETLDFPYEMERLETSKQVLYLGYFGANGEASVYFPAIYENGKEIIQIPGKAVLTEKELDSIIAQLKKVFDRCKNWHDDAAICFLYQYLIKNGNFKLGPELALKIGYTKEQADKFHAEVLEQIRNSKYSQELAKLNDIKL